MEINVDWVNAGGAILGGIGSSIAAIFAWLATRQANRAANESNQTASQLLAQFIEYNSQINRPRLIAYLSGQSISCCSGAYILTVENIGTTPAYSVRLSFDELHEYGFAIDNFWTSLENDSPISAIRPGFGIRHRIFDAAPHDISISEGIIKMRQGTSLKIEYQGCFSDEPVIFHQAFSLYPKNIEKVYFMEPLDNPQVGENFYHEPHQ